MFKKNAAILLRRVRLNCLQEIIFVSPPPLLYVCSALCDFFPSAVKDGRKNVIFFSRSDMRLCIYLHMYSKADALRRRAGIILTAGVYHNSVICIISLVKARANFRETRAAGFLGEFGIGKLNSSLCSLCTKCSRESYDARKYAIMSPKVILLQLKYT